MTLGFVVKQSQHNTKVMVRQPQSNFNWKLIDMILIRLRSCK